MNSITPSLALSPTRSSTPRWTFMHLSVPAFLAMLAVGAVLVRMAAVLVLRDMHAGPSVHLGADPVEFDSLAWNLARGAGYVSSAGHPTSFRAPGFPLFLSSIYFIAGRSYPITYLAFCLLGAMSCILTYLVARELLSDQASRLAALLAAVYVPHIYFATLLLSENLFVPVIGLVVWLALRHLRTSSVGFAAGAGLLLGLAILTRPFAILLLPILLLIVAAHRRQCRTFTGWPAAGTLLLCTVAVVSPWTMRNLQVHHHIVLVATNGGSTFYGGNNDKVAAFTPEMGAWVSTRRLPGRDRIDAMPDETSHDQLEWQLGFQWVRGHPTKLPLLLCAKIIRLFLPDLDSGNRNYLLLYVLGYTPCLLLMLRGIARCAGDASLRTSRWMLIHGVMFATLVTALVFWGSPRFREANMPLLMLYAVLGIGSNRGQIRRESDTPA